MKIAPSILDADFKKLQADLDSIQTCDRVHLDIMDGQYVPNISFGPPVLKGVNFPKPTEVHLMVDNPENFIEWFAPLGIMGATFHIENTGEERAIALLKALKNQDLAAGICIDGYTGPEALTDEMLSLADQVLVMSVKAGFGGQSFMPESADKIKAIRARGYKGEIEVDGGVNLDNVSSLSVAGADIVVVGSFLMKKPEAERPDIIKNFHII